jgi:NitT/TauT family transport system substrate-binding protein
MNTATHTRWLVAIFVFIILVVVTAGLLLPRAKSVRDEDSKDSEGKEHPHVSLRLNWTPDPTFAGAYMALATRSWTDAGLEVKIKEGGINLDPMRLVIDGTDDFGIVGADRLLQACADDRNLVAVALELRDNPVGWVVRPDSGIRSFTDLAGHRVGQKYGSETEAIWNAVVNKLNLQDKQITLVPVQFSADPFVQGVVDAFPVYVNEEPNTLAAKGIPVTVLHPADAGLSLYGNVVVTTRQTIQQRPEVVRRFVIGLIRGWEAAAGEPGAVSAELIRIEPDMKNVPTQEVLVATIKLARGRGNEQRFGWMEAERWAQSRAILSQFAGLKQDMNISSCYTNEFVEQYYARTAAGR